MENLKKVNTEDLVPGTMYSDMPLISENGLTYILEFVRQEGDTLCFKQHSGADWYIKRDDGTILFPLFSDFYELNDEQIQYLKTNQ